jgi:hypothetical protein
MTRSKVGKTAACEGTMRSDRSEHKPKCKCLVVNCELYRKRGYTLLLVAFWVLARCEPSTLGYRHFGLTVQVRALHVEGHSCRDRTRYVRDNAILLPGPPIILRFSTIFLSSSLHSCI